METKFISSPITQIYFWNKKRITATNKKWSTYYHKILGEIINAIGISSSYPTV